nr:PREDICTED: kinesin heavy chain-like [Latimeria chalumnae]|eukprot:XP_014344997.1 PREDICTED: kinesin heavy chain-like [Latimeria chalumnae]
MNVDVVGRIRASRQVEQDGGLHLLGGKTVSTAPGGEGTSFSFQELFDGKASTLVVFQKTLEPLLSVFREGMNVALLAFGETDSGKSYTLTGEPKDRTGIIPLAIDHLFSQLLSSSEWKVGAKAPHLQNLPETTTWSLSLSMYEIYYEVLKDLLQKEKRDSVKLELTYSTQDGTHIKNLVRWCDSSPCKNGGTCWQTGISYRCECKSGWTGLYCDVPSVSCEVAAKQQEVFTRAPAVFGCEAEDSEQKGRRSTTCLRRINLMIDNWGCQILMVTESSAENGSSSDFLCGHI